ncbi:DUF4032 domain-containing protein [Blastococcus sp. TML/M2B]|uniref:DUF4032 domain-containing protein n=1 Tax=Blastococcus sp. TML/M2B TaxID=2798727 RepID=UPI0028160A0C|nr:DUF4032 domain-containing protein [Blastococcus sp. TML/M2B]
MAVLPPAGGPLRRAAARHDGRAARAAAPGRRLLGRLLPVEHAVPAGRGHAGRLPGRRRDRRALPVAHPGAAPRHDVDLARERVGAELLDLRYGGLLPEGIDPVEVADSLPPRYESLWEEVTREETFSPNEQQYRVAERLRRLNELGFDVGEVEIVTSPEGARLRVETRVSEPGHNRRELFRLTGLEVQERQAQRLLNDVRAYRAHLEQRTGEPVPEPTAAHRWLADVYQTVMAAIPPELAGRLAPAEIFHEVLTHRWLLSERAGRDVGTAEAARSYAQNVLPRTPPEVTTPSVIAERATGR